MYCFLSGRVPVDLTAMTTLIILTFAGYVHADEAFSGFSSPAVITLLSTFFIGAAFYQTGLSDKIANLLFKLCKTNEFLNVTAIMICAGTLSAFLSNIAVTAILMPAVSSISLRAQIPAARLFIPLSFASVLGGTITMVGTAPNIIATQMLHEGGFEPFDLFSFSPIGLCIFATGTATMLLFGRHLLPQGNLQNLHTESDIYEVYKLDERLFSISIPKDSSLDGETLGSLRFGSVLGVAVVAIVREKSGYIVPRATDKVYHGDQLIVRGKFEQLKSLLDLKSFLIRELPFEILSKLLNDRHYFSLELNEDSKWLGQTLNEVDDKLPNSEIVALRKNDRFVAGAFKTRALQAGDIITIVSESSDDSFKTLMEENSLKKVEENELEKICARLFTVAITESSSVVNKTIQDSNLENLLSVTIVGVIRNSSLLSTKSPGLTIKKGDLLLISSEKFRVKTLTRIENLEINPRAPKKALKAEGVGVGEVSLTPRSELVGKTLSDINFREKYGLQVLALWREGKPVRTGLANIPFKFGDALLLFGSKKQFNLIQEDPDFVLLSGASKEFSKREKKIPFAIISILILICLVALNIQPVHTAAFAAAIFLVLTRTITMEQAYRRIEWRIIFLVACILPVGIAMQRSGAAELLANSVISAVGSHGLYAVMIALFLLATLMSQAIDGTLAVILLGPIAIEAANSFKIQPHLFMMTIAIAASIAFLTPFSHRSHLLVMSAGGYRNIDYLKTGLAVTISSMVTIFLLLPYLFGF